MSINNYLSLNYVKLKQKLLSFNVINFDDVYHEVLIQVLNMNIDKFNFLFNENIIDKYIVSMFKFNAFSKTAPYHRKYNKILYTNLSNINIPDNIDDHIDQICIADIENILMDFNDLFIYKIVYIDYILKKSLDPGFSVRQLALDCLIPESTLNSKFDDYKKYLKNNKLK